MAEEREEWKNDRSGKKTKDLKSDRTREGWQNEVWDYVQKIPCKKKNSRVDGLNMEN